MAKQETGNKPRYDSLVDNIAALDESICTTRQKLQQLREEGVRNFVRYKNDVQTWRKKYKESKSQLEDTFQRKNPNNPEYAVALKQVFSNDDLPPPYVMKIQISLLNVMHNMFLLQVKQRQAFERDHLALVSYFEKEISTLITDKKEKEQQILDAVNKSASEKLVLYDTLQSIVDRQEGLIRRVSISIKDTSSKKSGVAVVDDSTSANSDSDYLEEDDDLDTSGSYHSSSVRFLAESWSNLVEQPERLVSFATGKFGKQSIATDTSCNVESD